MGVRRSIGPHVRADQRLAGNDLQGLRVGEGSIRAAGRQVCYLGISEAQGQARGGAESLWAYPQSKAEPRRVRQAGHVLIRMFKDLPLAVRTCRVTGTLNGVFPGGTLPRTLERPKSWGDTICAGAGEQGRAGTP